MYIVAKYGTKSIELTNIKPMGVSLLRVLFYNHSQTTQNEDEIDKNCFRFFSTSEYFILVENEHYNKLLYLWLEV